MSNAPTTSWLKPPYHSRGLDPLGVQAPAINIYGQLLPGITNVTDRARYYSFYPWMIRTFEQLQVEKTYENLRDWVRKCDCLFTMIGVRHELVLGNGNNSHHAGALIGTETLRKVVRDLEKGDVAHLADFTVLEDGNPQRYFKTPLGGMQQYYIGSFDSLGLMTRQGRSVANTHEGGVPLADAMDDFVNRDLFVKTILSGEVTANVLDSLSSFCPCRLTESETEHAALIDLFFARKSYDAESGLQRRNTLGLLLDLVSALEDQKDKDLQFSQQAFRSCAYTGYLPNQVPWSLPQGLDETRRQWRAYQNHELLSAAVQCIFLVALRKIYDNYPEQLWTTQEFMHWFSKQSEVKKAVENLGSGNFATLLRNILNELPELQNWQNETHELQLAQQALIKCNEKHLSDYAAILEKSGRVLLALVARDSLELPAYDPLHFPPDFFLLYPLNLESLRQMTTKTWADMSLSDWLSWLAGYWGIEAHLRVAMRKLRFQNKETLHVLPTDQGLVVQEWPAPTYTTPRFTQGVQILEDLGAIVRNSKGSTNLTELGESLRKETHA